MIDIILYLIAVLGGFAMFIGVAVMYKSSTDKTWQRQFITGKFVDRDIITRIVKWLQI